MPAEPTVIGSFQDLIGLLDQQGVPHQVDPASQSVEIPTEQKGIEGVQLLRWQVADGVLQFIQSMLIGVPAERIAAVEGAIARLNHAMAVPGLDLNHDHGIVAYRVVLPILPRGHVEASEVQACFRLAVKTATDLVPTLRRVIAGEVPAAGVIADAQREMSGAAAAPAPGPAPAAVGAAAGSVFTVD